MSELYYYRPLAFFGGKIFKCAGICDASNADMANELFIEKRDPVYLPGFAVVDGYKGDKITIDRSNVAKEFKFGESSLSETMMNDDLWSEKDSKNEKSARFASAMAAVNELSKSMDPPTGRNYPAWNARKIEARRLMNSKPEPR